MPTYSKIIYVEIDADNESQAEEVAREIADFLDNDSDGLSGWPTRGASSRLFPHVLHTDTEGPCDEIGSL